MSYHWLIQSSTNVMEFLPSENCYWPHLSQAFHNNHWPGIVDVPVLWSWPTGRFYLMGTQENSFYTYTHHLHRLWQILPSLLLFLVNWNLTFVIGNEFLEYPVLFWPLYHSLYHNGSEVNCVGLGFHVILHPGSCYSVKMKDFKSATSQPTNWLREFLLFETRVCIKTLIDVLIHYFKTEPSGERLKLTALSQDCMYMYFITCWVAGSYSVFADSSNNTSEGVPGLS